MSDFLASIIRTLTTLAVGLVATAAVRVGVSVDTPAATAVLQSLITGFVYSVVRFMETKVDPRFGWLLGVAKAPAYPAGKP